MSQSVESKLSSDDYQLISSNHLGMPLDVYNFKKGYIILLRVGGLAIVLIDVIALMALFIGFVIESYLPPLLPSLLGVVAFILPIFIGWFILFILVPQELSAHVIICEHGLLQTKKKIRGSNIEVVHWRDMLPNGNEFVGRDYFIRYGEGKKLTLSSVYQKIDDLVALIMQQGEKDII